MSSDNRHDNHEDLEAPGRALILVDLLKLRKTFSFKRYREDVGGFLLAWAFVLALMLLLIGVAKAEEIEDQSPKSKDQRPKVEVQSPKSKVQSPVARAWARGPFASVSARAGVAEGQQGGEALPKEDARFQVRGVNTPMTFVPYPTREAWLSRAGYLREQILMAAGLWPMPERTPLNAQVFDRREYKGYSIEKAYFESYPGLFCTGNLYRPLGRKGPFPGVWSPHGHWTNGRLEHTSTGSIPARAINLALQGYVVFTPDMVGYNDNWQVSHDLHGPRYQLWGISVLGLQLWNSIRGLDFLAGLPDVDPERLLMTGASGGGTQTFLATAVDDRVKMSVPVNMVSAHMQGGCNCENAAGLRVDTFNVEYAACAAPRPLLMVAATGDWTKNTPRVEFPAVRSIYQLLGAEQNVESQQFDYDHNYNQASREAMYSFFGKRVLNDTDASHFKEKGIPGGHQSPVINPRNMLVFYGRERPRGVTEAEWVEQRIAEAERQLDALKPADEAGLERFRHVMGTALRHAVAAEMPASAEVMAEEASGGQLVLGRKGKGDRIPAALWRPKRAAKGAGVVLLVHPGGRQAAEKSALAADLLARGFAVFSIDAFQSGDHTGKRDAADPFFTTYNRTDDSERVQDILTAVAYLRGRSEFSRVSLVGADRAGLWVALARALAPADAVTATVADVAQFESASDPAYVEKLFIPLLRRAGDFRTANTLIAPSRLLLHNTGSSFSAGWAENAYRAAGKPANLAVRHEPAADKEIASWLQ